MHIHPPHKSGSDFKEHLLHFFMLLMAVILGAMAENLREEHLDNTKANEYLSSLVDELSQDTLNLNKSIQARMEKSIQADKLIVLLGKEPIENTKDVYYLTRLMTKVETFEGTNGTFNQLQYAGGFRLIENKEIIEKIHDYLFVRNNVYSLNKTEEDLLVELRKATSNVVYASIFSHMLNVEKNKEYKYFIKPLEKNEPLFSTNATDINNLIYWISSENGNQTSNMNQMKILKTKGKELIHLIHSEINKK
jgi:hypothetical protein